MMHLFNNYKNRFTFIFINFQINKALKKESKFIRAQFKIKQKFKKIKFLLIKLKLFKIFLIFN